MFGHLLRFRIVGVRAAQETTADPSTPAVREADDRAQVDKVGRATPTPRGYGTLKGRMPSHGKRPVGLVAVEGCSRNMKRTKKPTEV